MKKESKQSWIKYVCASLALAMGMSVVTPSVGPYASEMNLNKEQTVTKIEFEPSNQDLKSLGMTDEEITKLRGIKDSEIMLKNGVITNPRLIKNKDTPMLRGKLTWAVKILKAGYKKLPKWAKRALGGTAGFAAVLRVIDAYTGKVEDAVYKGCRTIGMNKWAAWAVTKTLMLLL